MSYPEPRYLGEQGEVSVLFRAAGTGADVLALADPDGLADLLAGYLRG